MIVLLILLGLPPLLLSILTLHEFGQSEQQADRYWGDDSRDGITNPAESRDESFAKPGQLASFRKEAKMIQQGHTPCIPNPLGLET